MAKVRMTKERQQTNKRLGERLAKLRRQRGLTQAELADSLGVGQPLVSHYERGQATIDAHSLIKLSSILEAPADTLLGLIEMNEPDKVERTAALRPFLRRLRDVHRLPERDRRALLRTIDAFLKSATTATRKTAKRRAISTASTSK